MAAFVRLNGLIPAMKALSTNPETCRLFASRYNGSGYAKNDYHNKLAKAMQ
ncbi:N-acetylmuramidase domain-containing protein [Lactobacillus johnsonii]|uniref:N-acetylmuramidase domain-containing protein n=1 Tax=Lactobacillus johnsonii TaxID=33959 RepID=UPI003D2FDA00